MSEGLAHRIEKGGSGCSLGAVFGVAAILRIEPFEAPPDTLTRYLGMARDKLTLLPKSVRRRGQVVKDDF